jgi:hypothetical protein
MVAGALGLLVAASGCTPDYVTGSEAPVFLFINSINSGAPLDSDVQDEGTITEDEVTVEVANRQKNPNFTAVPQVAMAIDIDRYEVRYFRSDGRNTEGVDVPYRITGNIRTVVDVGDNVSFPLEVVRRQAKLEPPLRNLVNGGGEIVITCFAEVTLHGRTTAGQAVQATGRLQIDFADLVG